MQLNSFVVLYPSYREATDGWYSARRTCVLCVKSGRTPLYIQCSNGARYIFCSENAGNRLKALSGHSTFISPEEFQEHLDKMRSMQS